MPDLLGRELVAEAFEVVRPLIEQVLRSDAPNRICLAVVATGRPYLNLPPQIRVFKIAAI